MVIFDPVATELSTYLFMSSKTQSCLLAVKEVGTAFNVLQVVVGAALIGAGYAAISYFNQDKDFADSANRAGKDIRSDARGKGPNQ